MSAIHEIKTKEALLPFLTSKEPFTNAFAMDSVGYLLVSGNQPFMELLVDKMTNAQRQSMLALLKGEGDEYKKWFDMFDASTMTSFGFGDLSLEALVQSALDGDIVDGDDDDDYAGELAMDMVVNPDVLDVVEPVHDYDDFNFNVDEGADEKDDAFNFNVDEKDDDTFNKGEDEGEDDFMARIESALSL